MLFGHLAVSALEHRYLKVPLMPVMAAAILPDAVDKVSHYVLGENASGRMWGHTLVAVLLSSLVILVLFGRHHALGWGLGYVSHLVCDISGVVPWFAPFVTYEFPQPEDFLTTLWTALTRPLLVVEVFLSAWAILALRTRLRPGTLKRILGAGRRETCRSSGAEGQEKRARADVGMT